MVVYGRRFAVTLLSMGLLCIGLVTAACTTPTGHLKRPVGLSVLIQTFGQPCAPATHVGKTVAIPWGNGQTGQNRLVVHEGYIPRYVDDAHYEVLSKTDAAAYTNAAWAYHCRLMTGSSTKWSTHAWGIAVDLNSVNNPYGQTHWNGNGGYPTYGNRGMIIPTAYQNQGFYWGLNFSTPDPMHFQYVEGY